MHLKEGLLQKYLDGEVSEEQKKIIENHLQECSKCQLLLDELRELDQITLGALQNYSNAVEDDLRINIDESYENFNNKIKQKKWKGMVHKMNRYKKLVAGLAATAVFATTLFIPPVREAAADFLHIFRVQKVESIQINVDDLQKMRNEFMSKTGEVDLKQLGKANVLKQPKFEAMPLQKAQSTVPFDIKYPADFDLSKEVHVSEGNGVEFTLNVNEVNKVLKQLGAEKLLPQELDNKAFTIYSPGSVDFSYQIAEGKWVNFQQIGSPEITVPDGIDVFELREVLLNIPILPHDLKQQLQAVQDWQHTLIVPTDENGEIVKINGQQAILQKNKYSNHLIWQADGVLYNLNVNDDQTNILDIANSLRELNNARN